MPEYKLIYFDGRGRGETIRLLFTLAGQQFTDERVKLSDWAQVKPTTLMGKLPMLQIDGQKFGQSKAIERYLAKTFGYYGDTELEQLNADQIIDYTDEIIEPLMEAFWAQEEQKAEKRRAFEEEWAPKALAFFESCISSEGYVNGSRMTWPDIRLFCTFEYAMDAARVDLKKELLKCPKLSAILENVPKQPKIAAFIAKRKPTMF